jgi:phenylpropionate dioxygenase-like ring-hydroxylating dioxygenase large terminal subunit
MLEATRPTVSSAADALGMEAQEVDRILDQGATLSAPFYTSEVIARVEDDRIWRREWQIVGVEPELRKVGDYLTTRIAGTFFDVPILVVRDRDRRLRAFANLCRHRPHPVLTGSGQTTTLRCGDCEWDYGLDGRLRAVPTAVGEELPFDLSLVALPVETWAGFVFVALDPDESLEEALGEFPQVLEQNGYHFPFAPENVDPSWDYVRVSHEDGGASNWKAQVENGVECYHCPTTHTHSFSDIYKVDSKNYTFHNFDRGVYHASSYNDAIAARLGLTERDTGTPEYQFYYLWPNMTLYGGKRARVQGGLTRRRPNGVHGCYREFVSYRLPGADDAYADPEVEAYFDEMTRLTAEEDAEAAARVQTGLKSGMYTWGYTLPVSERNMRHFYSLVWEALGPAFR